MFDIAEMKLESREKIICDPCTQGLGPYAQAEQPARTPMRLPSDGARECTAFDGSIWQINPAGNWEKRSLSDHLGAVED